MINYDDLWKELDEMIVETTNKKMPHERTAHELAVQWHMGKHQAAKHADELVKEGKLTSRRACSPNGRIVLVYSPIISS